ncbi:MAG: tautomerase family protein, partial [bacterium]|nr:tautomerase family protein [bacterium]
MPLIKIEMLKGKPAEYKRILLDEVHKALVESIKIPDHDRNQRIIEFEEANFEVSSGKTRDAVYIEITLFEGRTLEAKKTLYQNIVKRLEKELMIKPD